MRERELGRRTSREGRESVWAMGGSGRWLGSVNAADNEGAKY